jgi:hypothetical protein
MNFFDQFDQQQGGNFFDQFDRPPVDQTVLDPKDPNAVRAPKVKQPRQPKSGMGRARDPQGFLDVPFMRNVAYPLARGAKDVIDTGAELLARLGPDGAAEQVAADNKAGVAEFEAEAGGSIPMAGMRLGGNIAATLPVGPVLAAPVRAAGMVGPRAARIAAPVAEAIETGGFRAGGMTGLKSMPVRMAGGAITGGAAAAAINPDDWKAGALVGGALPPTLAAAGAAGRETVRAVRGVMNPAGAAAERLVDVAERSPAELAALLRQGNVELVPGLRPTTAQALQIPTVSRLEQGARQVAPNEFVAADQAADVTRRTFLRDRVANTEGMTAIEAAEDAGSLIRERALPARKAADEAVERAYMAVDPAGESSVLLPPDAIKQAYGKMFGSTVDRPPRGDLPALYEALLGVTGKQEDKAQILAQRAARSKVGAVDTTTDTLDVALRKWGGVNKALGGGEARSLREGALGKPSAAFGPALRAKGGMSWDQAAQLAHEAGYIDAPDERLLIDALDSITRGGTVYSTRGDVAMATNRASLREGIPTLTWDELKRLRSRAGAIVAEAGKNPELRQEAQVAGEFKRLIDEAMERVAAGGQPPEELLAKADSLENFPADMQGRARNAIAEARDYFGRFDTGKSQNLFRYGTDARPRSFGAEVAKDFVHSGDSQLADVQQLQMMFRNRATGEVDQVPVEAARRYALADLLQSSSTKDGPITAAAFDAWVKKRGPMLGALFPENRLDGINAVREDLIRMQKAQDIARQGGGSNTVDKAMSLGMLDSGGIDRIVNFIPTQTLRAMAGGVLEGTREGARKRLVNQLTPLLLDPVAAEEAMNRLTSPQRQALTQALERATGAVLPLTYRAAPAAATTNR